MHRSLSAALSSLLLVSSLGVTSAAAEPEPTPEARAHFRAGLEHMDALRNVEAYREFKAAYAISPKAKLLVNLGIVAERLERDGEAIDAYQGYLESEGLTAKASAVVRRTLERLRARVATVKLEAPGTYSVTDTRTEPGGAVLNEYGPFTGSVELRVRAGRHELRVDGGSSAAPSWAVTLLAGDAASHSFERDPGLTEVETFEPAPLPKAPEADAPQLSHTASYVLWASSGVGAAATVAIVLHAKSVQDDADDDFERRCPRGAGPIGCDAQGSQPAANWRTAGLVTGVAAAAALATGTVLYILDSGVSRERASETSVRPWVSPGGVGVSGAF